MINLPPVRPRASYAGVDKDSLAYAAVLNPFAQADPIDTYQTRTKADESTASGTPLKYGARGGETITGNLGRDESGRFARVNAAVERAILRGSKKKPKKAARSAAQVAAAKRETAHAALQAAKIDKAVYDGVMALDDAPVKAGEESDAVKELIKAGYAEEAGGMIVPSALGSRLAKAAESGKPGKVAQVVARESQRTQQRTERTRARAQALDDQIASAQDKVDNARTDRQRAVAQRRLDAIKRKREALGDVSKSTLKHMPGKHSQSAHGRRGAVGGAFRSAYTAARAGGKTHSEAWNAGKTAAEGVREQMRVEKRAQAAAPPAATSYQSQSRLTGRALELSNQRAAAKDEEFEAKRRYTRLRDSGGDSLDAYYEYKRLQRERQKLDDAFDEEMRAPSTSRSAPPVQEQAARARRGATVKPKIDATPYVTSTPKTGNEETDKYLAARDRTHTILQSGVNPKTGKKLTRTEQINLRSRLNEIEKRTGITDPVLEYTRSLIGDFSTTSLGVGSTGKAVLSSAQRRKLPGSAFVFPDTRSFPITDKRDIQKAVHAWGRYQGQYSFEVFKRRLTAIARRMGAVDALPDTWQVKTKAADHDMTPPQDVRDAAKRGLALRRQFGRGGTEVGIARARDLSNGASIPLATINRMVSFFARHAVDKRPDWSNPSNPSNGYIAWLLWGGDAGRRWALAMQKRMTTHKHMPGKHSQSAHGRRGRVGTAFRGAYTTARTEGKTHSEAWNAGKHAAEGVREQMRSERRATEAANPKPKRGAVQVQPAQSSRTQEIDAKLAAHEGKKPGDPEYLSISQRRELRDERATLLQSQPYQAPENKVMQDQNAAIVPVLTMTMYDKGTKRKVNGGFEDVSIPRDQQMALIINQPAAGSAKFLLNRQTGELYVMDDLIKGTLRAPNTLSRPQDLLNAATNAFNIPGLRYGQLTPKSGQ